MLATARRRTCCVLFALPVLAVLWSAAVPALAAQTQPWRVGVGGDLPTGFLGALSIYGLPHETILDREMTSASELSKFQIVILSRPNYGVADVNAAVEEYVRRGGCAIYEFPCVPSETMIGGRRIPPQKGPSMVYEPGSPVTAGLTDAILNTARAGGDMASIIPTDPKVQVLTRFTDQGAKKELQGKFVDGNKGAPAIIMADYGKGKVVWSGIRLSIAAAFDDNRYIAPFIANLVRELSGGEVTPRFPTQTEPLDSSLTAPQPYRCSLPRFTPGEAPDIPQNAEVLDEDSDSVEEFDLYGKVLTGSEAVVYLSYHNARWYRALRFDKRNVTIVRADGGEPTVLCSAPLPAAKGWRNIMVRRRWGTVTVHADGTPLVSGCDGAPLRGIVAVEGILDPGYQPVAPVYFTDDFLRTAEESDPWETVTGTWQMVQTEGEPSEGANPFRYQGLAAGTGKPAIATTGLWFWDDYSVEMSVFPDSAASGVIGHYQGPGRYILVRLATPVDGNATVSIVERTPTGDAELASVPLKCDRQRWYKLGLRATSGLIDAVLDGKVVASAPDRRLSGGAVGMYVVGGKAQFDDVTVTPWHGTRPAVSGWGPWEWCLEGDVWRHDPAAGAGGALTVTTPEEARALTPDDDYADGRFEAELKPGIGSAAGLLARYQGKDDFVRASLVRDPSDKMTVVINQRLKGRDRVLGSAPVTGDPAGWHRLSVETIGHAIAVRVDRKPCLQAHAAAAGHGALGLDVQGSGAFRDWAFRPVPHGEDLNDTPTPEYAGIIDRNSWAGRAGAWQPDPSALDAFWHVGYFPQDVELRLGVYRDAAEVTEAKVVLAPGRVPFDGYVLTATRDWGQTTVDLELSRLGEQVATGTVAVPPDADAYCLSWRREAGLVLACVNDQDGLAFEDPDPIHAPNLGLQLRGGSLLRPDDTRIASADLRNHTFDAAPTDWFIASGTWELTSRWPCTPGWAWFSGVSEKEALARTKATFVGDQEVQFYAGAKQIPKKGEKMRDIIVGLCGSDDPAKGYRFTIEASSGGTYLAKDGKVVARAESFVLSQAAIHFDWTSFAASKAGNRLSLKWWGRTILEYEDPDPLDGGYIWLGTFNNGISIPRVTIYGKQG